MFELQNDSPSTRERLVMIAAELLMRHSFETVSVDDICKAADIKKGTLYHHFPSKTDLALEAYDFIWAYARSKMDPCFSPTLKPLERLERYRHRPGGLARDRRDGHRAGTRHRKRRDRERVGGRRREGDLVRH